MQLESLSAALQGPRRHIAGTHFWPNSSVLPARVRDWGRPGLIAFSLAPNSGDWRNVWATERTGSRRTWCVCGDGWMSIAWAAVPARLTGWAWSEAGRLARRHGVHRTARALGLEYNKLKRTSGAGPVAASAGRTAKQSPARGGAVKFLELPNAFPAQGQMCRVRLAGPAGEHLELEVTPGAAKDMVLELCREGWGAQR